MIMLLQLAVDLDKEAVIMSFGPNPSLGSPGRFQTKEPRVGIMVESDTVEVGSSLLVSGSNFEPNQKVWIEIEFQGKYGLQVYCEADEDGSFEAKIELSGGANQIKIKALSQDGQEAEKTLSLVYSTAEI